MATIEEAYNNWQKVNVDDLAARAVINNRHEIEEKQRQQMSEGANKLDQPIGYYKSTDYANKKHIMNPKPGFGIVDLTLHGDFGREITLRMDGQKNALLYSRDWKNAKIIKKYGDEIFGFTEEYQGVIKEEITTPYIRKDLRAKVKYD